MAFVGVTFPGGGIKGDDPEQCWKIRRALDGLTRELGDAVVALRLFVPAYAEFIRAASTPLCPGELPRRQDPMVSRPPYLFARLFLLAAGRYRAILLAHKDLDPAFNNARIALENELPNLRGLCDSATHIEERLQGMARSIPIVTRPVVSATMNVTSSSAVFMEGLNGDAIEYTTADGELAELRGP